MYDHQDTKDKQMIKVWLSLETMQSLWTTWLILSGKLSSIYTHTQQQALIHDVMQTPAYQSIQTLSQKLSLQLKNDRTAFEATYGHIYTPDGTTHDLWVSATHTINKNLTLYATLKAGSTLDHPSFVLQEATAGVKIQKDQHACQLGLIYKDGKIQPRLQFLF
jgi:hypothetical protein